MILVVNSFFICSTEYFVSMVGMNFATNERILVSFTLFNCLLLNTCVMPILLQANFSRDYGDTFWDKSFTLGGRNSDFGATWYPDIGAQLIISAILLALQPVFNIIAEVFALKINRYMSRKYWYATHVNNHIDNIKFLELHAGPEYMFQLKTASLNALLFLSVCLGLSFPMLYPIALFGIVIQYIVERYTLAVFYRLPPKFSLDMTSWNNHVLMVAPLYGLGVAFWLLGNRQMFENQEVGLSDRLGETYESHHTLGQVLSEAFGLKLSSQESIVLLAYTILSILYFSMTIFQLLRPSNAL
jgi:hypothetical protein